MAEARNESALTDLVRAGLIERTNEDGESSADANNPGERKGK